MTCAGDQISFSSINAKLKTYAKNSYLHHNNNCPQMSKVSERTENIAGFTKFFSSILISELFDCGRI
jgi:hypothetical protein